MKFSLLLGLSLGFSWVKNNSLPTSEKHSDKIEQQQNHDSRHTVYRKGYVGK